MKEFIWSDDKNEKLKKERGVSFEQLVDSRFIGIEGHRVRPHQCLMLFEFRDYVWVIP